MADIINLRQFRKAREKAAKDARATENRIVFGRPKKTKTLAEKRAAIDADRLDGHRLKDPGEE